MASQIVHFAGTFGSRSQSRLASAETERGRWTDDIHGEWMRRQGWQLADTFVDASVSGCPLRHDQVFKPRWLDRTAAHTTSFSTYRTNPAMEQRMSRPNAPDLDIVQEVPALRIVNDVFWSIAFLDLRWGSSG